MPSTQDARGRAPGRTWSAPAGDSTSIDEAWRSNRPRQGSRRARPPVRRLDRHRATSRIDRVSSRARSALGRPGAGGGPGRSCASCGGEVGRDGRSAAARSPRTRWSLTCGGSPLGRGWRGAIAPTSSGAQTARALDPVGCSGTTSGNTSVPSGMRRRRPAGAPRRRTTSAGGRISGSSSGAAGSASRQLGRWCTGTGRGGARCRGQLGEQLRGCRGSSLTGVGSPTASPGRTKARSLPSSAPPARAEGQWPAWSCRPPWDRATRWARPSMHDRRRHAARPRSERISSRHQLVEDERHDEPRPHEDPAPPRR